MISMKSGDSSSLLLLFGYQIFKAPRYAKIAKWRRQESLRVTYTNRPDLLEKVELSKDDKKFLEELKNNSK